MFAYHADQSGDMPNKLTCYMGVRPFNFIYKMLGALAFLTLHLSHLIDGENS